MILVFLTLCALQPQPVADITIKADYYTMTAPLEIKDDVVALQKALDRGIEGIKKEFDGLDPEALLKEATVSITILTKPSDKAAPGHATIETGTRDGTIATYYANLYLLAPSAHNATDRTAANEPMDAAYCEKVLVHEYSTIILEMLRRNRPQDKSPRPWSFFSAPAWFVQGYEEYLGCTCGNPTAGKATLSKYIREVKSHPEWVSCDFGLDVAQPYLSGPVLIHFMHEKYGVAKVRSVFTSDESSFGKAIRASLGVGVDQFCSDWSAWLTAANP